MNEVTMNALFFDRDISWLSFNERVLEEAGRDTVPLLERIRFLSIYSANLDEFYRVRIPAIMALHKIGKGGADAPMLEKIKEIIEGQQNRFGQILQESIVPKLHQGSVHLLYNQPLPDVIRGGVEEYFLSEVAAFIRRVNLTEAAGFFPESNKIYLLVDLQEEEADRRVILNIPSDGLPRFYTAFREDIRYIMFLDDIIRENLSRIFPHARLGGCWSFKVTRDSELNLQDEYEGDLAEKIEKQIAKRDAGLATRLLYDSSMPAELLRHLIRALGLSHANVVTGGRYHNLRDLGEIPWNSPAWSYPPWPPVASFSGEPLFRQMEREDMLLHTPYESYDPVLRFFNEAALDETVTEINTTLYRVASDSRIVHALISAALNGKKVTVFMELLARFDEANNIRWAKKMKAAGIKIIYSIPGMKVHAKMAFIKTKKGRRSSYYGLLATGNLNETTARVYTDHILFTTDKAILRDMELLFVFLRQRRKPEAEDRCCHFEQLLVAQFNLRTRLEELIRFETRQAIAGKPAAITLKLNNLEEKKLIESLYRASQAGVQITLIIRGICCLVPGIKGMSENITVRRIVGRYLEHGRIYLFHHGGAELLFLGSADWMERNIYRRIEVCFPVTDLRHAQAIKEILRCQLADNQQAVYLDAELRNRPVPVSGKAVTSQYEIYKTIAQHENLTDIDDMASGDFAGSLRSG
jgi:polyphosphate kinase